MVRNTKYIILIIVFIIIDLFLIKYISNGNQYNQTSLLNKKADDARLEENVATLNSDFIIENYEIIPDILTSRAGDRYSIIGTIIIEKINLEMNISSKTTDELMKKYACRVWGPDINKEGNLCIIGHNWRNTKLFSKVPKLEIGDQIKLVDLCGREFIYTIYDKYIVDPDNTSCLNQETNGEKIITLITCTNDSSQRYVMHAK